MSNINTEFLISTLIVFTAADFALNIAICLWVMEIKSDVSEITRRRRCKEGEAE